MRYPDFFDKVPTIFMIDPLSEVLGTFEEGRVEFSYLDVVKAAGHSCPTVAGAYLMTLKALELLYPDALPVRGQIEVTFKEPVEAGVAGVIGNVISHITGATDRSGFKGLNGKFARQGLMHFERAIDASARFSRIDNGMSVDLFYHPENVLPEPAQSALMQRIMQGTAMPDERREFGILWQNRVRRILIDNRDDETVIRAVIAD